jgi:hypothetical protein
MASWEVMSRFVRRELKLSRFVADASLGKADCNFHLTRPRQPWIRPAPRLAPSKRTVIVCGDAAFD